MKTTVYHNNLKCIHFASKCRGFTLIEVLISVVLLIFILGTVYSSFFTVQRALERFDGVSLKYHEIRTALDVMRREIEGAFFYTINSPESEDEHTSFVIMDRDIFGRQVSRLQLSAFSFNNSGSRSISYYVKESNKKLTLFKTESLSFTLSSDIYRSGNSAPEGYDFEMIDGIEGFTVETLTNNKWVKTWDTEETGTLPEVVRFSIVFDDGGNKVKLTEYARPKTGKQL
jgi:general secretion pathway protein J